MYSMIFVNYVGKAFWWQKAKSSSLLSHPSTPLIRLLCFIAFSFLFLINYTRYSRISFPFASGFPPLNLEIQRPRGAIPVSLRLLRLTVTTPAIILSETPL